MESNDSSVSLSPGENENRTHHFVELVNVTKKIWHPNITKDVYPIMMPIVLVFCLISFLLSLLIICAIPFVKRPLSPTTILSLSLSASNVAFSGAVFIGTIVHSYLPVVFDVGLPKCLSLSIEAIRMAVILVQVYHLLSIALIHYLGTVKPLQYASIFTPYCLKVIVINLWTIPMLGIFIGFSSIPGQGFQSPGCTNNYFRDYGIYFRIVWSLIYFGPTVGLVIIYIHIFIILSRRERTMMDSEHRRTLRRNMKTVKTTSLIVVSFLVGWTPAVLAFLLICKDCYFQIQDMRISMAIFTTTYILIIIKVFVDTFIYALRLPEIREAIRLLYHVVVTCSFGNSYGDRNFRVQQSSTITSRSTYLNSIHSSFNSQKEKSLKKSLIASKTTEPQVSVEMKPLFDAHRKDEEATQPKENPLTRFKRNP